MCTASRETAQDRESGSVELVLVAAEQEGSFSRRQSGKFGGHNESTNRGHGFFLRLYFATGKNVWFNVFPFTVATK